MRKIYLDYLRVVAIIAVVTIHVTAPYFSEGYGHDGDVWWAANLLNAASRFSVPVFVMISGALLLGRRVSVLDFYRKSSLRIIPPLVFWNLFYVGFNSMIDGGLQAAVWQMKAGILIDGYAASHLWYLSMFSCLMVFAPFINQYINGDAPGERGGLTLLAAFFLFFVAEWGAFVVNELMGLSISWFKEFPLFIAYFVGGYFLDRYHHRLSMSVVGACAFLFLLMAAGFLGNYYFGVVSGSFKDYLVLSNTGPLLFLISLLVFFIFRRSEIFTRERSWMVKLSEASFGVYLIHPVFIYLVSRVIAPLPDAPIGKMLVTIVLAATLSFLAVLGLRRFRIMRWVS